MTRKEVIEYFSYLSRIDSVINNKLEEKEMLYALAAKTTSSSDSIPGSGASDKVGNIVVKIQELENEIARLVDDLADYRLEAFRYATKLPKDQFEVIRSNMIHGVPVNKIAKKKKMTYQWVSELKRRGINELTKIIADSQYYKKYKNFFARIDMN